MGQYFRSDKRIFQPGQVIRTAGHFIEMHPDTGKRTEELLEAARPEHKPKRGTSLMLFESEDEARKFCAKMSGGRLYAIEATDAKNQHRGDMTLVNHIAALVEAGTDVPAHLPTDYWNEVATPEPILEVLLESAVVEADLNYTQEERDAFIRTLYQIKPKPYAATDDDDDWPLFVARSAD